MKRLSARPRPLPSFVASFGSNTSPTRQAACKTGRNKLSGWPAAATPLAESGYTAAKLGCGEGGCGACTVMVSSVEPDGSLYHRSVNACLCPLYAVEGMHVITAEGGAFGGWWWFVCIILVFFVSFIKCHVRWRECTWLPRKVGAWLLVVMG